MDPTATLPVPRDERIAAEPPLPPPELPPDIEPLSMEVHQLRHTHPIAFAGIVENGMVRPVDPGVKLAERSRVIIVASDFASVRVARPSGNPVCLPPLVPFPAYTRRRP